MSANDLIDKPEAAAMIGGSKPVSISFINQLLAKRALPKVRLSYKVIRIPRAAVEEYISRRTINAAGGARL